MSGHVGVDPMLAALGLLKLPELPEDVEELLADHLELFLRGGGRISWAEWLTMSEGARTALAIAGDRLFHDQAEAIADSLEARLDAGVKSIALDQAAQEALRRAQGGKA